MRIFALLAAALLIGAPFTTLAASPTPDGTCGTGAASTACPTATPTTRTTTATAVVSTSSAAGCLIVIAGNEVTSSPSNTVTSVAASGGSGTVGSFTRRVGIPGTGAGQYGTSWDDLEEWYAPYTSALSSVNVTVTWGATFDAAVVQVLAITGTYGNGCAFDSTPANAFQGTTTGTPNTILSTTQSTTNPDDILIGAIGFQAGVAPNRGSWGGTTPTTLAGSGTFGNPSGDTFAYSMGVPYYVVSTTQSSTTVQLQMTGTLAVNAYGIIDALTADAPSGGGGATTHNLLMMRVGQ